MIRYNLKCDSDHQFEAWFRSSSAFDEQVAAGEIACPFCASAKVEKALMAPAVASRKGEGPAPVPAMPEQTPPQAEAAQPDAGQVMQMMTRLREHVEANCDYMGTEFAEEARKMHYGEAEKRDIYGEASAEENKALREEGIEAHAIPWLPRHDA